MGMPLSRYGMLDQMVNSLRSNEQDSSVDFRRFKMFVLVLHDPCDKLIYDTIRKDFGKMDYQTGRDMLFLSWVKPPNRWYEDHKEYYCFNSDGLLFDNDASVLSRNIELNEMRRKFGIKDNTSALVVFTELMSSEFLVVATSAETIANQLRTIGEFCYEKEKPFFENTAEAINSLRDVLGAEMAKINEIVADCLLSLLSIGSGRMMFEKDDEIKEQRAEAILKIAYDKVRRTFDNGGDAEGDILSLYDKLALREANAKHIYKSNDVLIFGMPQPHDCSIPSKLMDDRLLEGQSVIYRQTYNTLYQLYAKQGTSLDYSALIVYLAKILECECNASVYQYCRKLNDIPMPEFYNKYCPDISFRTNLEFVIGNRTLSCPLNRYTLTADYKALETRTLGELQTLIRWLQQGNAVQPWDELRLSDQGEWHGIVNLRNYAAHGGSEINDKFFSIAFNSFEKIVQESFGSLSKMKRICSN